MTHTMASSRPNSVDQDSVTLMSQCLNTAAKEIQIRAQVIFSSEGLQNAQVQKLLEADGAAFRWANVYGLGASVSSGALCFYMSRSWWLAARVPFVGFTSLLCGPAGYLYGTKVMVDSLLKDTQTPCAAAKVLCPSLEKLQPCMDDWKCSEIMRRDYGGQTMLSWRDLCRARPQDQMELEAQQIGDNWGVDESGWGSAMDQQGGATQGFK